MGFQPGVASNPNGRPVGSRNKRTQQILDLIASRGDKDPLDFLSDYIRNGTDDNLKVAAANIIAPYKHSKCGSTPPLRYIEEPIDLPRPTTLDQANANIALISEMKALGRIDLDFADSLIADNRTIANNLIAEEALKLKIQAASPTAPNQNIILNYALPPPPGTDVIMPEINGVRGQGSELRNGHTIDLEKNSELPAPEQPKAPESDSPDAYLQTLSRRSPASGTLINRSRNARATCSRICRSKVVHEITNGQYNNRAYAFA